MIVPSILRRCGRPRRAAVAATLVTTVLSAGALLTSTASWAASWTESGVTFDVDVVTDRSFDWVTGLNRADGVCLAVRDAGAGTQLAIGGLGRDDDAGAAGRRSFLALANPAWASIRPRRSYPLTLTFNRGGTWPFQARGLWTSAGPGLRLAGLSPGFLDDFARSSKLTVTFDGQEVGRLFLPGSRSTLRAIRSCQEDQRDAIDPFAGQPPRRPGPRPWDGPWEPPWNRPQPPASER